MNWIRPQILALLMVVLTSVTPHGRANPPTPAEAAELRKQLSHEAQAKITQKEYRAAILLLKECTCIQEQLGEVKTPNTIVYFLYLVVAHARLGDDPASRAAHEASLTVADQYAPGPRPCGARNGICDTMRILPAPISGRRSCSPASSVNGAAS